MFNFNRKEKGQGLVEYALILVLVAVIVIVVLQVLGPLVGSVFTEVNSGLTVGGSGGSVIAAATPTDVACIGPNQYPVPYGSDFSSCCSGTGSMRNIGWGGAYYCY